jgi:hypothetical protein
MDLDSNIAEISVEAAEITEDSRRVDVATHSKRRVNHKLATLRTQEADDTTATAVGTTPHNRKLSTLIMETILEIILVFNLQDVRQESRTKLLKLTP